MQLDCNFNDSPVTCRASPLGYVQRAVAVNEFDSARWGGKEGLGGRVLNAFSLPAGYWWVWLGVGVIISYIIVLNIVVAVATSYLPRKCPDQCHLL